MKKTLVLTLVIAAVIVGCRYITGIVGHHYITGTMPFEPIIGTSMEPELRTGDLVMIESVAPSEVEVGDIIVYGSSLSDQEFYKRQPLIVHRVVEIEDTTIGLIYRTKGDNNPGQDPWSVRPQDLKGKVEKQIPYLGFFLLFLGSNQGLISIIIALCLYTLYLCSAELSRRKRRVQRRKSALLIEER